MMDLQKSQKQSKSFSAKTVMKDYKMSSLVSDAIQSPVGSTQRKRASALLKSLRKMRENNNYRNNKIALMQTPMMQDGKGGLPGLPGGDQNMSVLPPMPANPSFNDISAELAAQGLTMGSMISGRPLQTFAVPSTFSASTSTTPTSETPKMTTLSSVFSNMFDFSTLNAPDVPSPKYTPVAGNPLKVINTQTGQMSRRYDDQGRDLLAPVSNISSNNNFWKTIGQGKQPTKFSELYGPIGDFTRFGQSLVNIPKNITKNITTFGSRNLPQNKVTSPLGGEVPMANETTGGATNIDQEAYNRMVDYGVKNLGWDPKNVPTLEEMNAQAATQSVTQDGISGVDSWTQETTPQEVVTWASSWYSTLNSEDQERFASLYKAVNTGMGPEAFAYAMMSDREEMHKMFPDTPVDQLPMGASLARQIVDLKQRTREETGLNKLEVQMNAMQSRGYSALPVLSDYIAGKDQYLGKIDKMIADTKDKLTTMDTSDPTLAKSMNDYTGYLYVLKGRQNKRYGDYLQQSIDAHNAEADRLNDQYKTVSTRYQDEIANQSAIAQEEFNSWKTLLGGVYNGADQWENRQLEQSGKKLANEKVKLDMMLDAFTATGGLIDPKSSYVQNAAKYDTIIEGYLQPAGSYSDPFSTPSNKLTEIWTPGVGTIEEMMTAISTGGLDPNGVIDALQKRFTDSVQKPLAINGNIDSTMGSWSQLIKNYAASSTDPSIQTQAQTLAFQLQSRVKDGINSYLSSNIDNLKEVLNDLIGTTGWINKRSSYGSPDSRDEFIANNKDKLSESVLGKIFDSYNMGVLQAGGDPNDFYNSTWEDSEVTSKISQMISNLVGTETYSGQ